MGNRRRNWWNDETGEVRVQISEPGSRARRQPEAPKPPKSPKAPSPKPPRAPKPAPAKPAAKTQRTVTPAKPAGPQAEAAGSRLQAAAILTAEQKAQVEKIGAAARQEMANANHPLHRLKSRLVDARFSPGGPSVRTLVEDKANPLAVEDHKALASSHARVGSLLQLNGHAEEAKAQFAAARYHNGHVQEKTNAQAKPAAPSAPPPQATPPGAADQERPLSAYAQGVSKWFEAQLGKAEGLSAEQHQLYAQAIRRPLAAMPDAAIRRVAGNLKNVHFHASGQDIAKALVQHGVLTDQQLQKLGGGAIGGMYISGGKKAKSCYLDGALNIGGGEAFGTAIKNIHGAYAHELSHALDGPDYAHSRSPEWRQAYQEEIVAPAQAGKASLSKYGASMPHEGWAEFGRLLYGTDADRAKIEKRFPKCAAYWKKQGFWK